MSRFVVAAGLSLLVLSCPALAQTPSARPAGKAATAKGADISAFVHDRIDSAFKAAADSGDLARAAADLQVLFDQLIAYSPDSAEPIAHVASALRLASQLSMLDKESQRPLLAYMRAHEELARTLPVLIRRNQPPKRIYAVLDKLRAAFGDKPAGFPALTSAICVVHARPITARASQREGEKPRAIDPVEVFRYYTSHESEMVFGPRSLPAELQVFMVDSTAEMDELSWALEKYAGDRNPGNHYNELTYDTAAYKFDKPKKISTMPYTLPNLRQVGGVCEERAYFASNVGKAIGVPAVPIYGVSATDAHAWVGVLQSRGSGLGWVLDQGCFGDYKKLRGYVNDPQGGSLAAPELNMIAASATLPESTRLEAIAYADAAQRLAAVSKQQTRAETWPPAPPPGLESIAPTSATMPSAIKLLERAVKLAPMSPQVWAALAPMARSMSVAERTRWSETLLRTCENYSDFAHRTLGMMIDGIDEPAARAEAWEWVSHQNPRRADLRVEALLSAGKAWEKAGDNAKAYDDYQQIWENLINDTAESLNALSSGESLLKASGKKDAIANMYGDAFRRVARPSTTSPGTFSGSNFYRIGMRYAKSLDEAGRSGEALTVRNQLKAGETKDR